jgi:hypothetical protein
VPGPQITLTIPALPEYLRLVRLMMADAGSRVGLDYEEIDDLKIAASEACGLVLDSQEPLTLAVTLEEGSLVIHGTATTKPRDDEFVHTLIVAVVDEYETSVDSDRSEFRLVKRHRDGIG